MAKKKKICNQKKKPIPAVGTGRASRQFRGVTSGCIILIPSLALLLLLVALVTYGRCPSISCSIGAYTGCCGVAAAISCSNALKMGVIKLRARTGASRSAIPHTLSHYLLFQLVCMWHSPAARHADGSWSGVTVKAMVVPLSVMVLAALDKFPAIASLC